MTSTSSSGFIRDATIADAPALSALLAATRTDLVPMSESEVAALIERVRVLVLDHGEGWLGGAAQVVIDPTQRRAVFRVIAVHPELAARGVEERLAMATIATRDTRRFDLALHTSDAIATHEQFRLLRVELGRRMMYLTMLLLALPHVIASAGTGTAAVVMFVWSALALLTAARTPRIPRAIVHRRRAARLRAWRDAVWRRLGELPLAPNGRHVLPPGWQEWRESQGARGRR